MAEFFSTYGLFLLEVATVVGLVLFAILVVMGTAKRAAHQEGLEITHLNKKFESTENLMQNALLAKGDLKKAKKARRKEHKQEERAKKQGEETKPRIFVINFKGDIRASATASLREEVSAILTVAGDKDKVLVRLENPGGAVHEHGLAASQLLRLKRHGIELIAAIDKVAASGGYLMACVADNIIAAPFAVVGSIGVIAQLPNFHRWLEQRGIDYEQITAGQFKRTLTVFGENTDAGREKLKEEIEDVHELFKAQIVEHRPQVEIERVSTGEHWYGLRALELKLIDEIGTSDDYLAAAAKHSDLYELAYKRRRPALERMMSGAESLLSR